jgi:hypothetical protein
MQTRMLKLRTRARTKDSGLDGNSLDGVCDRALKNAQEVKKCDYVLLPEHFCYDKFMTERCTANETLKS